MPVERRGEVGVSGVDHGIASSRWWQRLTFEYTRAAFYIGLGDNNQNVSAPLRGENGKEAGMTILTRRSVLRSSLGLAAAGTLARPYIANAAATTAEVWFAQGFIPEEDSAFKVMAADYEKESGNKIEHSLIPYAALRQKAISAISSGVVPDMIEVADFALAPMQSWDDKLDRCQRHRRAPKGPIHLDRASAAISTTTSRRSARITSCR